MYEACVRRFASAELRACYANYFSQDNRLTGDRRAQAAEASCIEFESTCPALECHCP